MSEHPNERALIIYYTINDLEDNKNFTGKLFSKAMKWMDRFGVTRIRAYGCPAEEVEVKPADCGFLQEEN